MASVRLEYWTTTDGTIGVKIMHVICPVVSSHRVFKQIKKLLNRKINTVKTTVTVS